MYLFDRDLAKIFFLLYTEGRRINQFIGFYFNLGRFKTKVAEPQTQKYDSREKTRRQ